MQSKVKLAMTGGDSDPLNEQTAKKDGGCKSRTVSGCCGHDLDSRLAPRRSRLLSQVWRWSVHRWKAIAGSGGQIQEEIGPSCSKMPFWKSRPTFRIAVYAIRY